jgi:hypothetical protein
MAFIQDVRRSIAQTVLKKTPAANFVPTTSRSALHPRPLAEGQNLLPPCLSYPPRRHLGLAVGGRRRPATRD